MIKSWLRKRIIVEQLYDGKCINCNEDFIGSLTFHHLNPSIKKDISSKALTQFNIEKLVKMLIEEKCVCLCGNCHRMLEASIFRENYKEILNEIEPSEKDFKDIKTFYDNLEENLKNEYERINYLKNTKNYTIINYLKSSFSSVWEKYLLVASILINLKKKNSFTSSEINIIQNSSVSTHITYLKKNKYIKMIGKKKSITSTKLQKRVLSL